MSANVLIVYQNLSLGGVTSVILDRVATHRAFGDEVTCLFARNAGGGEAVRAAGARGVHVHEVNFEYHFRRLLREQRIDTVLLMSFFHLAPIAAEAGARTIIEYHGSWLPDVERLRGVADEARALIVPSAWSADVLRRNGVGGATPIVVWPNKVRVGDPLPQTTDDDADANLVWVGRIAEEHKNWRDAVSVAAFVERSMRRRGAAVRTRLILSNLQQQGHVAPFLDYANSAGLTDLDLLYNLPPDLFDRMLASWARKPSVMLSTSKAETFGIALAQAAASGMRCVAARGGALESVFSDESVAFYDRGAWADAGHACIEALEDTVPDGKAAKAVAAGFEEGWRAGRDAYVAVLREDAARADAPQATVS